MTDGLGALATPLRFPKPALRKPYKQGQLDGLCGLYAIVNALAIFHNPRDGVDEDEARRMLRVLIEAIPDRFPAAIWGGTMVPHIRKMLHAADAHARKRLGFGVSFHEPFRRRHFATAPQYLGALRDEAAAEDRLAIIGLAPPWDHWTLARSVDETGIQVSDTETVGRAIPRSEIGLRHRAADKPGKQNYVIDTPQTFVLTRVSKTRPRAS